MGAEREREVVFALRQRMVIRDCETDPPLVALTI